MRRATVIDTSTGKPWIPPDTGWLSVKFRVSRELPNIKASAFFFVLVLVLSDISQTFLQSGGHISKPFNQPNKRCPALEGVCVGLENGVEKGWSRFCW